MLTKPPVPYFHCIYWLCLAYSRVGPAWTPKTLKLWNPREPSFAALAILSKVPTTVHRDTHLVICGKRAVACGQGPGWNVGEADKNILKYCDGLSWRLESLNVSVGHDGVMKVGPDKLQQPHQHQHQPVLCQSGVKKRDMSSEGYLCIDLQGENISGLRGFL